MDLTLDTFFYAYVSTSRFYYKKAETPLPFPPSGAEYIYVPEGSGNPWTLTRARYLERNKSATGATVLIFTYLTESYGCILAHFLCYRSATGNATGKNDGDFSENGADFLENGGDFLENGGDFLENGADFLKKVVLLFPKSGICWLEGW